MAAVAASTNRGGVSNILHLQQLTLTLQRSGQAEPAVLSPRSVETKKSQLAEELNKVISNHQQQEEANLLAQQHLSDSIKPLKEAYKLQPTLLGKAKIRVPIYAINQQLEKLKKANDELNQKLKIDIEALLAKYPLETDPIVQDIKIIIKSFDKPLDSEVPISQIIKEVHDKYENSVVKLKEKQKKVNPQSHEFQLLQDAIDYLNKLTLNFDQRCIGMQSVKDLYDQVSKIANQDAQIPLFVQIIQEEENVIRLKQEEFELVRGDQAIQGMILSIRIQP